MEKYITLIRGLIKKYRNLLLYGIIGMTGVTIDFLLFLLFTNVFKWDMLLSNLLSVSVAITNNFILNTIFNFKTKDRILFRFISFYSVGILGLIMSSVILKVFVDTFGFNTNIVKLVSIIVVIITQYILNKTISFKNFKDSDVKSNKQI